MKGIEVEVTGETGHDTAGVSDLRRGPPLCLVCRVRAIEGGFCWCEVLTDNSLEQLRIH